MFRVLLVPFLVILILAKTTSTSNIAAVLFVIGAATDGLDGYLARRYSASTRTGQWLDPLADKMLVAAPVITLTALGRFPAWAAIVIVVREVGIALLRVVLVLRGVALPASRAAKVKTSLQLVAITLYILPLGHDASTAKLTVLVVAVALTVVTGVDYLIQTGMLRRPGRPAAKGLP